MEYAPFIAPYSDAGVVVHRIAGHGYGRHLNGRWYTLCGRIAPGVTVEAVDTEGGERECKRCAAKAAR